MSAEPCPRCCGPLLTKQVDNLLSKYCKLCGSLPHATNVKTGKGCSGRSQWASPAGVRMTDTPIKATRWHLFTALGARRLPPTGPHIVIRVPGAPTLFWPIDPEVVEEVAGT